MSDEVIFDDIHALYDAYQMRNKARYKLKLLQLEVDLVKYLINNEREHESSKRLIKFYEMMWEF